MKSMVSIAVLGLAAVWSSSVFAEDPTEKIIAEMKKCAVCKNLAEDPELMKNMSWETDKIDNGMLSVSSVPKEMQKEYDEVSEKMHYAVEQVAADAKAGKQCSCATFARR
jgi:hypothetical protein